jgi:hypothetical protein
MQLLQLARKRCESFYKTRSPSIVKVDRLTILRTMYSMHAREQCHGKSWHIDVPMPPNDIVLTRDETSRVIAFVHRTVSADETETQ